MSKTLYRSNTTTPIKHLVVLFDENESFDHYFGTYPFAANTDSTKFTAKPNTPKVNGLYTKITKGGPVGPLLTSNPNAFNPQRLTRSQALTSDQNHGYLPEQRAVDGGKMDNPYFDTCSDGNHTTTGALGVMSGQNIGDLLNAQHVTWGWFQGGFAPTATDSGGAICGASHANVGGATAADYSPHHNPFEYYASTANPEHLAPSSLSKIGYTDQANHQYGLSNFSDALSGKGGAQLPAVSHVKPPEYQDAHPGYSDPLDEQTFLVNTINSIEKSKYWDSTAIVVTYDDSDGWYDHVAPPIVNGSNDAMQDAAICTSVAVKVGTGNDRCGFSQRLPFVVISPYTKSNTVSSNLINTASVVKFIEDNWLRGKRISGSFDKISGSLDGHGGVLDFHGKPNFTPLILNPATGAVVSGGTHGHQ